MVISLIEIELRHHAGYDNGRLPVTTDDFARYGMHRTSVAPGIREAEALGFIRVTQRGRGGNAEHRSPNLFFLTFAHGRESSAQPPPHDWRRIETMAEAERIAREARANKNPAAIAHGKRSWRKRLEKQKAGTENSQVSTLKSRTDTAAAPVRKTRTTGQGEKPVRLSIAREGSRSAPHGAVASDPSNSAFLVEEIMRTRNCSREEGLAFLKSLPDAPA
jgi:hypothetical protein